MNALERAEYGLLRWSAYIHACIVTGKSLNAKTGKVAATYASIHRTCPATCPHKGVSCYAQYGRTAIHVHRVDKAAEGLTAAQLARIEAWQIDLLYNGGLVPGRRALRLHVAGDARTRAAARILGRAATRWVSEREGGPVWTYTHAWATVPRTAWGPSVSVLASIEHPRQAAAARRQGYAPALVVDRHDGTRPVKRAGVTYLACREQTSGVPCVDCRLCFDADSLREKRLGIAFAIHGAGRKRGLNIIQ